MKTFILLVFVGFLLCGCGATIPTVTPTVTRSRSTATVTATTTPTWTPVVTPTPFNIVTNKSVALSVVALEPRCSSGMVQTMVDFSILGTEAFSWRIVSKVFVYNDVDEVLGSLSVVSLNPKQSFLQTNTLRNLSNEATYHIRLVIATYDERERLVGEYFEAEFVCDSNPLAPSRRQTTVFASKEVLRFSCLFYNQLLSVPPGGLEPPTTSLEPRCSIH